MDEYKQRLWGMYEPLGQEWHANHAAKQAYISFGVAIAAAAEQQVDATPMEGFIPAEVDSLLGLNELGLKSVLVLPLGYRDHENDWLVNMKKVRTPQEDFITEIK
jgi:nitroreductase